MSRRALLSLYAAIAIFTLIFQIYVRYPVCTQVGDCALSYAKAVAWSVIWPASWLVYGWGK